MVSNKESNRKIILTIVLALLITIAVVYFTEKQNLQIAKIRLANVNSRISTQVQRELFTPGVRTSVEEADTLIAKFKHHIENRDGYKLLYDKFGKINRNEKDIHHLFDLVCSGSSFRIEKNTNNGRGAADVIVSYGGNDVAIIEFKLASNSKLKKNLKNQTDIYKVANNTSHSRTVILVCSEKEERKVKRIIAELDIQKRNEIVVVDARFEKPSASNIG